MNKNVAATRADIGPVFNVANLLTDSVGRFGWLEWGGPPIQLRAYVHTDQRNPHAWLYRKQDLALCHGELQAYVNIGLCDVI